MLTVLLSDAVRFIVMASGGGVFHALELVIQSDHV
jgi:hypothetical protein